MLNFLESFYALARHLRVPSSAYVARSLATLDLTEAKQQCELEFRAKWTGAYELGIIASTRVPMPLPDNWQPSSAHVKFTWADGCHEIVVNDAFRHPWYSVTNSGFTLVVFTVPIDVPLKTSVRVDFTLERVCPDVARFFRSGDAYFCKRSDK